MQPVLPWRAQAYPPSGSQWPLFADQVLGQTLNVTQDAHQSLMRKREERSERLDEDLEYHGLKPKGVEYYSMAEGDVDEAHQGTQTESSAAGAGTQTERRQFVSQFGVAGRYDPPAKTLVAQTQAAGSYEPAKKQLAYQRGVAVSMEPEADDATVVSGGGLDPDAQTVNYGDDPLDIDDHEMQTLRKREGSFDEETKKKPKVNPRLRAASLPGIKVEGSRPQAVEVTPAGDVDSDVEVSGLNINRNSDMAFWQEQSAREMRAQLNMRHRDRIGDWAFKDRKQLLSTIQDMIHQGIW